MLKKTLVLIILDGWGYREDTKYNAIAQADLVHWKKWWATEPHILINASGHAVGLPDQQMGNSEVGHMHIGAGRIVPQDLTRIQKAIEDRSLFTNKTLLNTFHDLKQSQKKLHIMGLLSPGGVHSHESHLYALLDFCQQEQVQNIALHLFLDGRDTPPQSAHQSLLDLQTKLLDFPNATIHSMSGRYYAMDRDKRWDRTQAAYELITSGHSNYQAANVFDALEHYYAQSIFDEFIPPTQIGSHPPMQDGDALLFFNFRQDRARQLSEAFLLASFSGFKRKIIPKLSHFISMTPYADYLPTEQIFPKLKLTHTLGDTLAQHAHTQLRIAETEKYPHVTFFFNGGIEEPFPYEDRILIPSPQVSTYDQQPEMSAPLITKALVEAISKQTYDFILCNFANADMVGHTGNFAATLQAVDCLDQCLFQIHQALQRIDGQMLITADHGNAEAMFDENTQQAHTAHTSDPVPLLYLGDKTWYFDKNEGSLIDIAPTVLRLMGLNIPHEMSGQPLLKKKT